MKSVYAISCKLSYLSKHGPSAFAFIGFVWKYKSHFLWTLLWYQFSCIFGSTRGKIDSGGE